MAGKNRQTARKPATKLPHLQKKMRKRVPHDRVHGKKRIP